MSSRIGGLGSRIGGLGGGLSGIHISRAGVGAILDADGVNNGVPGNAALDGEGIDLDLNKGIALFNGFYIVNGGQEPVGSILADVNIVVKGLLGGSGFHFHPFHSVLGNEDGNIRVAVAQAGAVHTVDFHIYDGILHLVDDVFRGAGAAVLINLNIQGVTGIDIQFIAQQVGFFVIQGGVVFDRVHKQLVSLIDRGSEQGRYGQRDHQQQAECQHHFFHALLNLAFVI